MDLQVIELDIWAELISLQMCTISLTLRTQQWNFLFHKTRDRSSLDEKRSFSFLALNYAFNLLETNFKCVGGKKEKMS
jgi:hypothetical protein